MCGGSGACSIVSIQKDVPTAGEITIKTKSVVSLAATNLQTVVSAGGLSLVSTGKVSDFGN